MKYIFIACSFILFVAINLSAQTRLTLSQAAEIVENNNTNI